MTAYTTPELELVAALREGLGDQADVYLEDFVGYLRALGETSYRSAWDVVERTGRDGAEDILTRAERRRDTFLEAAQVLAAHITTSRPETLADVQPAWAAATMLLPVVPV